MKRQHEITPRPGPELQTSFPPLNRPTTAYSFTRSGFRKYLILDTLAELRARPERQIAELE